MGLWWNLVDSLKDVKKALEALEDSIDIENAKESIKEGGSIPGMRFRTKHGLENKL